MSPATRCDARRLEEEARAVDRAVPARTARRGEILRADRSVTVLGCRVDALGRDEAVEKIAAYANRSTSAGPAADGAAVVVTLGVEMVMEAQRNDAFRRVVNSAALVTCDSIGLLLAARMRGAAVRERVTGVELLDALARRSASRGDLRLYLFGGAGDTARRAAASLQRTYPGLAIAGARSGYFREDENGEIVAAVRASGANLLIAGLGFPKQELWLSRYLGATGCGAGIGVGGSLDVYAGNVMRAPAPLRRIGLEWAYRLFKEPRRWRRQLALPRFALAALAEALSPRKAGNTSSNP